MNKLLTGTPFQSVDACGAGLLMPRADILPDAVQPFFELGTKLQSEFMTLMSHRAQACMDWPRQLVACRSATDLARLQIDFLTGLQRDYVDCLDAVMSDALVAQDPPDDMDETGGTQAKAKPKPSKSKSAARAAA